MKVLILHGLNGSDFPHWQAHLAADLIEEGEVLFPDLSECDHPDLEKWIEELREIISDFSPDCVVCHSLANLLWIHYLLRYPQTKVEKQLLVAPPSLTHPLTEALTFFPTPLVCVAPYAHQSLLVLSTNDPYLPLDEAKGLEKGMGIPVKWIEEGGHITTSSGFGAWSFPQEWILR